MKTNHIARAGQPSRRNRISRHLAAAAFAVGSMFVIAAPAQASDRTADRIAGTLVGAGIGAILGDHIGGREGAKVGGLIGATVGLTATAHATHHRNKPYYGHRNQHRPVYDHGHRAHHKGKKFARGYRRGFDDGKYAFHSYPLDYAHDVEYELAHRHPRFVKGYRVGFRDGIAKAREVQRRIRNRHHRRHGHGQRYHPNDYYGKVNKPIHREYRKPRHHQRQGHGFSNNRNYESLSDRP